MISWIDLFAALDYNPETGVWMRLQPSTYNSICRRGERIDRDDGRGYRIVSVFGEEYYSHQLAWFYITGSWLNRIDHENTNPSDNAWKNLRPCNQSQNIANAKINKRNTSGVKGVYWDAERKKWHAQIVVNYKAKFLGRFDRFEDAVEARRKSAVENFGEFARA